MSSDIFLFDCQKSWTLNEKLHYSSQHYYSFLFSGHIVTKLTFADKFLEHKPATKLIHELFLMFPKHYLTPIIEFLLNTGLSIFLDKESLVLVMQVNCGRRLFIPDAFYNVRTKSLFLLLFDIITFLLLSLFLLHRFVIFLLSYWP